MAEIQNNSAARLATLSELRTSILPNFLQPVPSADTLRVWFDAARIPRFKFNAAAKRGGGVCYYSIPAVEKLLRSRIMAKVA